MEIKDISYVFKGREVSYDDNNNEKLGGWVYGLLTKYFRKTRTSPILSCITSYSFGDGERQVKTETICQSLGVRDTADQILYEHDICYSWDFDDGFVIYRLERGYNSFGGDNVLDTSIILERVEFNQKELDKGNYVFERTGSYVGVDFVYDTDNDEYILYQIGNSFDDMEELYKKIEKKRNNFCKAEKIYEEVEKKLKG